jgi:hypothetical protein
MIPQQEQWTPPKEADRTPSLLASLDSYRHRMDFACQLHQVVFLILFPGSTVLDLKRLTIGDLITEMQLRTLLMQAEVEQMRIDAVKQAGFRAKLAESAVNDAAAERKAAKRKALAPFLTKE